MNTCYTLLICVIEYSCLYWIMECWNHEWTIIKKIFTTSLLFLNENIHSVFGLVLPNSSLVFLILLLNEEFWIFLFQQRMSDSQSKELAKSQILRMIFCHSEETSITFESKGHNKPLTVQQCYMLFLGEIFIKQIPFCKQSLLTAMSTLYKWPIHPLVLNSFSIYSLFPEMYICGFDILCKFKGKQLLEVTETTETRGKVQNNGFWARLLFTPSPPRTVDLIKLNPKSNINCFPATD